MEGGRATTDIKICGGRFGGLFLIRNIAASVNSVMDTRSSHQGDFVDGFWVQTAAPALVVAVLLEVAAEHFW
jgi:hypothetical protein